MATTPKRAVHGWFVAVSTAVILLLAALASASEFDPLEEVYSLPISISVPPTVSPPKVEGKIGPTEWDCASAFTGFFSYTTGEILDGGPTVFLAYDETTLYVLFVVPQEEGRSLLARVHERDGKVFTDDSAEMFFCTPKKDLFQIAANSVGAVSDFRNGNITWNGAVTIKAGEAEDRALPEDWGLKGGKYWFIEAAIPSSEFGVSSIREGDKWSVNFAVNRPAPWAAFAPTIGCSYSEISRFCALTFLSSDAPYAQITSLGDLRFGDVDVRGKLFNPGPKAASITVDLDLRKKGSYLTKDAYRNVVGVIHYATQPFLLAPGARVPVSMKQAVTNTSVNQMAFRVAAAQPGTKTPTTLVVRSGTVKIEPPLSLKAGNVPSKKRVVLSIDASSLGNRIRTNELALTVEVLSKAREVVLSQKATVPVGVSDLTLDYAKLPVGSYRCQVTAFSEGQKVADSEADFNNPSASTWLTSSLYDDYGKTDRIPKPWTPVTCGQRSVSVWGRRMSWGRESILPRSIQSQGTELLKRPMQLIVTLRGRQCSVPLRRFRFTEQKPNRVAMVAEGETQGLTVAADVWVEYDGFLWVTLRVRDSVKGRKVDALHITVPMDAEQTTLYQTFCRSLTGWIGDKPIKMPWLADAAGNIVNFYHWFGDEDKGLGFTYTSLEHWFPESEDNFCTLYPGKAMMTYRVSLVEKAVSVDGRTYQFGIQATPIKPLPPDYHSMLSCSLNYNRWTAWQQMPENMDSTVVWPPPRMKGLNDPYNTDPKLMADVVKYAHDKGVAVLFTGCPQKISPFSQEFEDWRLEWQTLPDSILNWESTPHYQNCGRSYTLRKWLFYGWAVEIVKKFGFDGIYYDGWQTGQIACCNPHHGCGWTDEGGKRHLTVPVLEGRAFNQRMLLFLEDNVNSPYVPPKTAPERRGFPRDHYRIHSWEFVPSVMGFATSWLTGEFTGYPLHGPSMLTPEGTFGKCMGLDLLRTRCLSTNWGVPNMFHVMMWEHTESHPTDKQTLMAYAWLLPHGVPLGELTYMNQRTVLGISKIMMSFGTRKANFTPGWRKNPYLEVERVLASDPPGSSVGSAKRDEDEHPSATRNPQSAIQREVLVATWDYPLERKVLAVVSNLSVDKTRTIALRWKGFANPKIRNAGTGEQVKTGEGRFSVTLSPESFLLLRFEK